MKVADGGYMIKKRFKILDLLLPREAHIFTHLNAQVDIFVEACRKLNDMVKHIDKMSSAERKRRITAIKRLELEGDRKERETIEELDRVFILPLDREDIHAIVLNIDNAIDLVHTTAKMMNTHDIRKKDKCLTAFSKVMMESANHLKDLIYSIEKRNMSSEIIAKIHKCENEADELFNECMIELFKSNDPIDILKRKDIYETMENLVDEIDSIAKHIRGVFVKQG